MSRWIGILLLLSLAGTPAVWADSAISDAEWEDVSTEVLLDLGIDGDMAAPGTPVTHLVPPKDAGGYDLPHSFLTERIIWDKTPVRLTLPIGHERLVHFPGPVRVGIPAHINAILRSQSVDGTVYWRAAAPFESVRVQVHELESGQVYLFDLQAEEGASAAPVQILLPSTDPKPTPATNGETPANQPETPLSYVALTRFAAQQMYAPSRLLRDLPGISRIPLSVSSAIPLLRGAAVQATPLIAWHGGGYYLTVVRLRNLTPQHLILDPRDLRGSWLAATFQHARLFPHGDEADTTCVYLISTRPFDESLQGMF